MSASSSVLDHEAYAALLQQLGVGLAPAECHGGLVGMLCATDAIDSDQWAQELLAQRSAAPAAGEFAALSDLELGDDAPALRRLYESTVDQLEDADYGFTLLLPTDQRPLQERAEALSEWCQGFLWGLGLGGIQDQAKLPGDVNEVMRDMAEISRLNFAAAAGNNDDETAYAEIVEYVRMAVLLIYEELRLLRVARPDGGVVH